MNSLRRPSSKTVLQQLALLAAVALAAACGGGTDSPLPVAQTPLPSPAPSPSGSPAMADAVRGKALYAVHCSSCHTASARANVHNILFAANNPQAITDAINSARSGMRSLDTVLSAQDRADVAAYLANPF